MYHNQWKGDAITTIILIPLIVIFIIAEWNDLKSSLKGE